MQLGQNVTLYLRQIARRDGGLNGTPERPFAYRRRVLELPPVYDPDMGQDGDGANREVWVETQAVGGSVGMEGLSALEFLEPDDAEALARALLAAVAASRGVE